MYSLPFGSSLFWEGVGFGALFEALIVVIFTVPWFIWRLKVEGPAILMKILESPEVGAAVKQKFFAAIWGKFGGRPHSVGKMLKESLQMTVAEAAPALAARAAAKLGGAMRGRGPESSTGVIAGEAARTAVTKSKTSYLKWKQDLMEKARQAAAAEGDPTAIAAAPEEAPVGLNTPESEV